MKNKVMLAAGLALAMVGLAQAYEWSYQTAGNAWTSNDYQSVELSYLDVWRFFADGTSGDSDETWPGDYTNGVGQVFDVTNSFTVKKVRIWSGRYYNTNDLTVSIYKDVNTDPGLLGNKPEDYMLPENLVAQFTIDPGTNAPAPGGTSYDVLEIALATNEYFELSPLGTLGDNTNYYFHVTTPYIDPGTNTPWWLFHWHYSADFDTNGFFVVPEGTYTGPSGRDLGIAFQSTNPPVVIVDPTPSNWFETVADTWFRPIERPTSPQGTSTAQGHRHHNDGTQNIRDYFSYVRFDLTELAGATITNASFNIEWLTDVGASAPDRVTMFGLNNVDGNTPQDWDEPTIRPVDLGAEFILANVATAPVNPTFDTTSNRVSNIDSSFTNTVETYTASNKIYSISGPALVDWLNTRLQDADTNGVIYATLIVSSEPFGNNYSWSYHSREGVGTVPYLDLDWIPGEPQGPQFDPTIEAISVAGGTVTISWNSDSNGTYRIESKSALTDPTWNPVPAATNLTGGAGKVTPVPVGGAAEFYRVYGE